VKRFSASFMSKFKVVHHFFAGRRPATVEVHPSYRCNYKCSFCIDRWLKSVPNEPGGFNINRDSLSMLSLQDLKTVADGCKNLGVSGVILSGGGDPLINPHTKWFVEKLAKSGIQCGMFTNGSLLSKKNVESFVSGLTFLRVSFDDFRPEFYAETKGVKPEYHARVLKNIAMCVDAKRRLRARCRLGIDFIVQPSNIDRIPEIYEKSNELGVDYVQFCDCVIPGYEFTKETKKRMWMKIHEAVESGGTAEIVYEPLQAANATSCGECEMKEFIVLVGADGGVRPCPHLARHDELMYGNVHSTPLEEIWEGRPEKLPTKFVYEHCRFRRQNEILNELKRIEDGGIV